jgi:Ca2+-binding EF-hand superfamily protein
VPPPPPIPHCLPCVMAAETEKEAAVFEKEATTEQVAAADRAFKKLNTSGSGRLSTSELGVLCAALKVEVTQEQLLGLVVEAGGLESKHGSVSCMDSLWLRTELLNDARRTRAAEVVGGDRFVVDAHDYEPRALLCLELANPFRLCVIHVVMRPVFDAFILLCIAMNSVMMAMDDPLKDEDNPTELETQMASLELVFNIIFTVEMILKIVALGFVVGERSYLHSPWNILDFVVVVSAWLPYVLPNGSANTGGIRAFRLLRPLRAVTRFPGLKRLVTTLFMAIPQLQVLVIMVMMYIFVFSVVGTQLWHGALLQRCHNERPPHGFSANASSSQAHDTGSDVDESQWVIFDGRHLIMIEGAEICDVDASGDNRPWEGNACSEGQYCAVHSANPYYDVLSFDSFGSATIPTLQMATVSSWQEIMHITQDATGMFAVIYFLLGTIFGGYFLLNLTIAVLKSKFEIASAVADEGVEVFSQIDADGSGELDVDELGQIFESKGMFMPRELLVEIFATIDDDDSGHVDLSEFESWLRSTDVLAAQMREHMNVGKSRATGSDRQALELQESMPTDLPLVERIRWQLRSFNNQSPHFENLFQYYDADKSGTISHDELALILRRDVGQRLTSAEVAQVFDDLDEENDGEVDADDFGKWVMKDDSPKARLCWLHAAIQRNTIDQICDLIIQHTDALASLKRRGQSTDIGSLEVEIRKKEQHKTGPFTQMVSGSTFHMMVVVVIVLNIIILAADYHGVSDSHAKVLRQANMALTVVFVLEMVLRIVAGLEARQLSGLDMFDVLVAIGGALDIVLEVISLDSGNIYMVCLVFRMFRVTRLMYRANTLNPAFIVALRTLGGLIYIVSLAGLAIFIFSILGMQLFGGKFLFDGIRPRAHYDSFGAAFATSFQIMTYDSWQVVLYDGVRSSGGVATLYFISWVVIGSMLLLNLLLVIILDVYEQVSDVDAPIANDTPDDTAWEDVDNPLKSEDTAATFEMDVYNEAQDMSDSFKDSSWLAIDGPIRTRCAKIANAHRTDHFIIAVIICNCVTMAMDHPDVDPDGELRLTLDLVDFVFTLIFTVEMFVRIAAFGLATRPDAYLRNWWNRLDFAIVIISWLDYLASAADIGFLKTLRLLRALRALRMFNRLTGLRVLLDSLVNSVAALETTIALAMIVFCAFAILGVALFKGKFWHCQDDADAVDISTCVGAFVTADGSLEQRMWTNPAGNFDSFPSALFTLFCVSTGNDWVLSMYAAIDAVGVDKQPKAEFNQLNCIFFMLFIMIVNWLLLNLFIGIIYSKYVERASTGKEELSKAQKQWLAVSDLLCTAEPQRDLKELRRLLGDPSPGTPMYFKAQIFDVVSHPRFEISVMGCILLNCLMMAGTFHGEPEWWTVVQDVSNIIFTLLFTVEAALKMSAFGLYVYFTDGWCQFDLFVVIGSWMDLIFTYFEIDLFSSSMFRIVRVSRVIGRIGRLLKLLGDSKSTLGLEEIMLCLYNVLPQLAYIAILVGLILFIFGVLAMNLFGKVILYGCLNEHANFQRAPTAVLTLLGVATKDRATCTMQALMVQEPFCDDEIGNCGSPTVARLFFVLFSLVIMFTTLEMFVNVVLQSFEDLTNAAGLPITLADISSFAHVWKQYDPLAEGWIDLRDLPDLFAALPPRVGVDRFDPLAGDLAFDPMQLRLPELPEGQFSRYLMGESQEEVDAAGTPPGESLRIERILRHCYTNAANDRQQAGSNVDELSAEQLHVKLAQYGLSRDEVNALVQFVDSGTSVPSPEATADTDEPDGHVSIEEFREALESFRRQHMRTSTAVTRQVERQPDVEQSLAPATDTGATRDKTRSALLNGLRSGALEQAVTKMEEDTAALAADAEEMDETMNAAALKIQAVQRGRTTRQQLAARQSKPDIVKPLVTKAAVALHKLIAGRLAFPEVLFAVCQVRQPLPQLRTHWSIHAHLLCCCVDDGACTCS